MGKAKARISPNHENMWNLGREWEMKRDYNGKRNWKLVENTFLREKERDQSPFFW